MPDVRVGANTVTGAWSHHQPFGVQFKVDAVTSERPETREAILVSQLGCGQRNGEKTAARIVELFGEDSLRVMEEGPCVCVPIKGSHGKRR